MNSQHAGDMIEADAYSVEELREALFEGRGRVARPLALALLSRKNYPDKVADFKRLLIDEAEQPRLRALAATGLGQISTPASLRALERGLESRDNVTLRAVTKALASVGTRKHVATLESLASDPGPIGRDAQRALDVLIRRLNLTRQTDAEMTTLPLRATGDLAPIRIRAATAGDVANVIKALPGRKLARRGAVSMDCQGRHLVFVFNEASLGQGLDMFNRGGEVGIVAEPPTVEGVEWSARYRVTVLAEPEAFRVMVDTVDGRPVLLGRGTRERGGASFELAALDMPGAVPVEIRGRFEGEKVRVEQALSGVRRRSSPPPNAEADATS
jgi:HEAT repeats